MRAALPFLLAAVLGVGCGVLAACGSGSGDRSDLIPQSSADRMKSALDDVRSAVDNGNCDSAGRALARARGVLVNLPASVDDRLVNNLRQGFNNLTNIVPKECQQQQQQSTSTETTAPETTTETTPANTATTDTTPTTPTTSTGTTTTPPTTSTGTTTTPPPTTTTTTPPPADTTGGVNPP